MSGTEIYLGICLFVLFIYLFVYSRTSFKRPQPLLGRADEDFLLSLSLYYVATHNLRLNPPDVGVTNGQKSCTKIIYVVLQTSVGLF